MPVQAQGGVSPQLQVQPVGDAVPIRQRIVAEALWGIRNEPKIHYEQIRPIPVHDPEHTLPLVTDCSGFVTLCYRWAGAPDPNGRHYDGQGYTGTLLANGKPVALQLVRPGDLVIFGANPGHHVCLVLDTVKNPKGAVTDLKLASHGQERGPIEVMLSIERQFQPSPVSLRSYLP